jgi:hypothetical protein
MVEAVEWEEIRRNSIPLEKHTTWLFSRDHAKSNLKFGR